MTTDQFKTLIEFLARWFKSFTSGVNDVKVKNPNDLKNTAELKSLENKLTDVRRAVDSLNDNVGKLKAPTSIEVSNLPKQPEVQKVQVTNEVKSDNSPKDVKILNWPEPIKLPEYPKFPEIKIPEYKEIKIPPFPKQIEVSNLPKKQTVEGEVAVSEFQELLKGVQVVVDSITDLKTDLVFSIENMQNGVGNVVATSMGSHKYTDADPMPVSFSGGVSISGSVTIANPVVQYTEGDSDASITGTVVMFEGSGDALKPVSDVAPLPITGTVLANLDSEVQVVGLDAIDAGISNAPIFIGGRASTATPTAVSDDGDMQALWLTREGAANVNIISSSVTNGGTSASDDADFTAGTTPGTPVMGVYESSPTTVTDGDLGTVGITSDRKLKVQADLGATDNAVLDAIAASVASIDTDTTTIIGHVDGIEALLTTIDADTGNIDTSLNNIETAIQIMDDWDNAASDGASVSGDVAHDTTDAGEPVKIGYKAYSPDGTTPGTAVAENDRTNAKGDLDGRLFTNTRHPRWWSYHSDGSSALTDASVQADPGDGFEIVITEITFSTGAATACNIFFEEGSTKILGPWYLEAVAGRGLVWRGEKHVTASTALTVTTSAAIAQSVDVQGYIQAV